jgi:hypothetical protein
MDAVDLGGTNSLIQSIILPALSTGQKYGVSAWIQTAGTCTSVAICLLPQDTYNPGTDCLVVPLSNTWTQQQFSGVVASSNAGGQFEVVIESTCTNNPVDVDTISIIVS